VVTGLIFAPKRMRVTLHHRHQAFYIFYFCGKATVTSAKITIKHVWSGSCGGRFPEAGGGQCPEGWWHPDAGGGKNATTTVAGLIFFAPGRRWVTLCQHRQADLFFVFAARHQMPPLPWS